MTERDLFLAIGEVDESLIVWANRPPVRRSLWKWAAVAAAAVMVVAGGVWSYARLRESEPGGLPVAPPTNATVTTTTEPTTNPTQPKPPIADTAPGGLPWLSGSGITDTGGHGGHNGYVFAYDFADLRLSPIWQETPETMTVWQVSDAYTTEYALQLDIIRRAAALLDDDLTEAETNTITDAEGLYHRATFVTTAHYRYTVESDRTYLTVLLQQPVAMGEQAEWLTQVQAMYPALFADMTAPAIHITGGERGWSAIGTDTLSATEAYYPARVYDAADPDGTYAPFLKGVGLWISEGRLHGLYLHLPEYYERVGEYPVLSRQEAQAVVESRCAAYVAKGYENPAIDETYQVMGAELVYYGDSVSRLRVPVYRFFLTAADVGMAAKVKEDTGMQVFVEVCISAVPEEYWHPDAEEIWSPI